MSALVSSSGRAVTSLRRFLSTLCVVGVAALTACGGGSGGTGDGGGNASAGGGGGTPSTPLAANVLPLSINKGVAGAGTINLPFVSVTLCKPGDATVCQTIDHVLLDTGSTGLRVLSSVLSPSLGLPQESHSDGRGLAQCFQFLDGTAIWGPVRQADVKLGGETLSALSVHVVGESGFAAAPDTCSGELATTPQAFGSNAILGVGSELADCGTSCSSSVHVAQSLYYTCVGQTCSQVAVPLAEQLRNPVAELAVDNNGLIIQFPDVPDNGAATVAGTLTLGINTQANNMLGSQTVLTMGGLNSRLSTSYKGRSIGNSFFDTGSNFLYFTDSTMPTCTQSQVVGFYCPSAQQSLTAEVTGANGARTTVNFKVANAAQVYLPNWTNAGFDNLAADGDIASMFDWGMPFFYGRTVYTAFEGRTVAGTSGPWIAF